MKYERNFNKTLFVKHVLLYSCNKASRGFLKKYSLTFNVWKKIKYTFSFSLCCINCKNWIEQTKIVSWNNCSASWIFFDLSIRLTKQLQYALLIKNIFLLNICLCLQYYNIHIYIYIYIYMYTHIHTHLQVSQVYLEPLQTSKMEC